MNSALVLMSEFLYLLATINVGPLAKPPVPIDNIWFKFFNNSMSFHQTTQST